MSANAPSSPPGSDPLLQRLRAALETLESTADRRARRDSSQADAEAEFTMMQDDRARLAVELDAALDAKRVLTEANSAAMERVTRAAGVIESWLSRASA